MPRPTCAYCGNTYGSRVVRLDTSVVPLDKPDPPPTPRPGETVVRESHFPTITKGTSPNAYVRMGDGVKARQVTRTYWNGQYSAPYSPFCTLRCALAYARKAYKESA